MAEGAKSGNKSERGTPLGVFPQVRILQGFKSFVSEVRIPKGLEVRFAEVRFPEISGEQTDCAVNMVPCVMVHEAGKHARNSAA